MINGRKAETMVTMQVALIYPGKLGLLLNFYFLVNMG
jgi:hypothetical protein